MPAMSLDAGACRSKTHTLLEEGPSLARRQSYVQAGSRCVLDLPGAWRIVQSVGAAVQMSKASSSTVLGQMAIAVRGAKVSPAASSA